MLKVATPRKRTPAPPTRARFVLLLFRMAALAAPAALLSGCSLWDPWFDSSPGSTTGSGSNKPMQPPPGHLPEPLRRKYPPPELDAAGQQRANEVEAFLAAQYLAASWQIVATTQTASGDIYDWMDVNSVEGSEKEPPPPPTGTEFPDGAAIQLTELDVDPDLERPTGTVPVLRRDFAAYVLGDSGASSLENFFTDDVAPGDAAGGKDFLYAGMVALAPNRGANATINAFGGIIEEHTTSLLEMVVGCPKTKDPKKPDAPTPMWQYIGIAASRDWATQGFHNFGDFTLRLQVEFFTEGTTDEAVAAGKGGWSGTRSVTDFIPAKGAPYGPGVAFAPESISTVGGPQHESLFQIKWVDGDWWVGHNGHWLGYYPRKLFDDHPPNLLATQACQAHWYGEVYASSVDLNEKGRPWTWTDMGSGAFAEKGWSNAAYFRDPSYVSLDAAGTWAWLDSDPKVLTDISSREGYNPGCYTKTALQSGPAPWERFFYVGGPGAPSGNEGGSATCK